MEAARMAKKGGPTRRENQNCTQIEAGHGSGRTRDEQDVHCVKGEETLSEEMPAAVRSRLVLPECRKAPDCGETANKGDQAEHILVGGNTRERRFPGPAVVRTSQVRVIADEENGKRKK